MKYVSTVFAIWAMLIAGVIYSPLLATNPEFSKWIRNVSEGSGEAPAGRDDYAPELAISGNVVHVLWSTTNNWATRDIYYRRSPDGGRTWESKKLMLSTPGSGEGDLALTPKMFVSGNYVHIAVVNKVGSGPSELFYYRSVNGGQSFEAPRTLYSVPQSYQDISYLRVKGDGSRFTIAFLQTSSASADEHILHLFNSEDNGAAFNDQVVDKSFNGYTMYYWDIAVHGASIFFIAYERVGDMAYFDFNLHFFTSLDRGATFKDQIISVPAMNGKHHPFDAMDGSWGYTPKIFANGGRVWVTWAGLNEANKAKVFVRSSFDGGLTFTTAREVSGDVDNFQAGHESIVAKGNEVYVCFLCQDSRIYVAESHNAGLDFDPPFEFTQPNDHALSSSSWGPLLVPDPVNNNAHLIGSGPYGSVLLHGILKPGDNRPSVVPLGITALPDSRRACAAFAPDGRLHIIFQAGRAGLSTGVFTDYDIFYRVVDPNFKPTATEDKVLKLSVVENKGDGTGAVRFDQVTLAPSPDLRFTEAMSVEIWVKPEKDRAMGLVTHDNGSFWNQGDVEGFILWTDRYQGLLPVTNIVTTSGQYPMSSKRKMMLNTWNHLAVTYDKNGGAQNFRLYLNGLLVASTTAVGDLICPDAPWRIGAGRETYRESFDGQVDELRFWSKALTQQEIRTRRFGRLQGNEPGLVAYYNFDEISPEGQVADITQRGNTGYLMYQEEVQPGAIADLGVKFNYVQEGAAFYFTPISAGAKTFEWTFGDNKTSQEANPVHTYTTPGTYEVCLTAGSADNAGSWCEQVQVKGIDRVSPTFGGNTGGITLQVYGGGFNASSKVFLRKAGQSDITAIKNIFDPKGSVTAVFDLTNKALGGWDVVVNTWGSEQTLANAFQIVPGEKAKPWVTYSSGGHIRINTWTPQTITIGNSANVDAYGVVLWVAVPNDPDFDIKFLNLNVKKPQLAITRGWTGLLDDMGLYVEVDSVFGKPSHSKLYSFYFPYLPARSSFNIATRVISKKVGQNAVQVAVSAPFYASPLSIQVQGCIAFAAAKSFVKAGLGFIPVVPCITGTLSVISDIADDEPPTPSSFENIDVKSFAWNIGTNLFECATSLIPGTTVVSGVLSIITSAVEGKQDDDDCRRGFWPSPFSIFQILYYGVTSLDPNEKLGVSGFGADNYIPANGRLSYQINFENKPTASAPAQEVTVVDTLKSPLFDLANITFGPVGFSGKTFYPTAGSGYDFALETDLRPAKNAIVRMSGVLDTVSRIMRWTFTTFDPVTRDVIVDPMGGFLPPNVLSPEGEGFVTFSAEVKAVSHNSRVENRATIVFDQNQPIPTNKFVNMFDLKAPQSSMSTNKPVSNDTIFTLQVQGTDDGSSIRVYEIYVSENNAPFTLDRYVSGNTFSFTGKFGSQYRFYSIAQDNTGNREAAPTVPDVSVAVVSATSDLPEWEGLRVYPVPAGGRLTVEMPVPVGQRIAAVLTDLSGREIAQLFDREFSAGLQTETVLFDLPDGVYLLKVRGERAQAVRKVVVER